MTPWLEDPDVTVYHGDCIAVMRGLPEASVDAVVTDPPYGIGFMGHEWDQPGHEGRKFGQITKYGRGHHKPSVSPSMVAGEYDRSLKGNQSFQRWCETWAREALRVLKPGGHLLAFGGPRTFHRLTCAIEDAGFEVRDCLSWLYGSGFPKSLDVSKAIDRTTASPERLTWLDTIAANPTSDHGPAPSPPDPRVAQWEGFGTAAKPAWEPIVLARKPLAERTVARQVLATGTGAIDVDGCRIETGDKLGGGAERDVQADRPDGWDRPWRHDPDAQKAHAARIRENVRHAETLGRWPANVVLDEAAAEVLDAEVGESAGGQPRDDRGTGGIWSPGNGVPAGPQYGDRGGPSRFFYTAKASAEERKGSRHPTVKPLDLMRWLVRMVTPPGGLVLDPFAGSGTTGLACRQEGVRAVLIEREVEYLPDIARRLRQLSLLGGAA